MNKRDECIDDENTFAGVLGMAEDVEAVKGKI